MRKRISEASLLNRSW